MEYRNKIFQGHWKEIAKTLPANSIDCIVTSPPYYGLRDYGTATWEGGAEGCSHSKTIKSPYNAGFNERYGNSPGQKKQESERHEVTYKNVCEKCGALRIDQQEGHQATPEEFINSLVEGFRLLRPSLKDTGTLWVNIGDSYANDGKWGGSSGGKHVKELHGETGIGRTKKQTGLKPKDLIGIPWMLAFALRADGWYLRSEIIWHKPNPMPESVTDRPTKSHEQIFLLSKSPRYYYDAEAIKEPSTEESQARIRRGVSATHKNVNGAPGQTPHSFNQPRENDKNKIVPGKRNKRSVWTVTTKAFKDAHFACYPPDLIEPCIKAGTSEKGNCASCGAPWSRILEAVLDVKHTGKTESQYQEGTTANRLALLRQAAREQGTEYTGERRTMGWQKNCNCETDEVVPPVVYDPFMGSGTTAEAAKFCGCDYSGSELNPNYVTIKNKRLFNKLGLFNL